MSGTSRVMLDLTTSPGDPDSLTLDTADPAACPASQLRPAAQMSGWKLNLVAPINSTNNSNGLTRLSDELVLDLAKIPAPIIISQIRPAAVTDDGATDDARAQPGGGGGAGGLVWTAKHRSGPALDGPSRRLENSLNNNTE